MKPITKRCKACGTKIYWARTGRGATMPVDAEKTEAGNVVLKWSKSEAVTKAEVYSTPDDVPEEVRPARLSHFVTCPKRDDFR